MEDVDVDLGFDSSGRLPLASGGALVTVASFSKSHLDGWDGRGTGSPMPYCITSEDTTCTTPSSVRLVTESHLFVGTKYP